MRFDDWLFVSGTSALTNVSGPIGERRLVEGIEAQTRETLADAVPLESTAPQEGDAAVATLYHTRVA